MASRQLIDELSLAGVAIYQLNDFDMSRLAILHTLHSNTCRYRFAAGPNVIDVGTAGVLGARCI